MNFISNLNAFSWKAMQLTARPVSMTVIEIKPHRWGWKVFEAPGVEPVFPEKRQAIDYAETRACFRSDEIRIFDSTGKLKRSIAFNESGRRL
jgi:hypothetical protein